MKVWQIWMTVTILDTYLKEGKMIFSDKERVVKCEIQAENEERARYFAEIKAKQEQPDGYKCTFDVVRVKPARIEPELAIKLREAGLLAV